MSKDKAGTVGFIGLGVMGEPICRNMLRKSGRDFLVFDLNDAPLQRLAADGARLAPGIASVADAVDLLFLSLPGGKEVEAVCRAPDGLLAKARPGQIIVDMSTAPVGLTRTLAEEFAARGAIFCDAPVARTRQAAIDGTLSIMVGADEATYGTIRPLLEHAASEVTLCGPVGCGQIVKIMNNMVLFQTVVALAEALSIGGKAGIDEKVLLETMSKGSSDSFALRNHGMKAMLPRSFPDEAFPTDYALKDVSYALDLARDVGVTADGAQLASDLLKRSSDAGNGRAYFPALIRLLDAQGK
ncbi:NAD(P)-dependent oxidoreductase [Oceanibaculum indicum]|uniref:3-hydroxyisobutyrate dehydrogenase n=1 Tax=Oceanibaculum indicum P24 TaxID=1207063 RepID=K2K0V8_9PROT|nr:NAD(P)-dependent oxidoreductase [Oceanibaculum indicum]EKE76424.1 3-hydroxyisobutyrate dehydrogenase [Oceanibaculum indicum P24]